MTQNEILEKNWSGKGLRKITLVYQINQVR